MVKQQLNSEKRKYTYPSSVVVCSKSTLCCGVFQIHLLLWCVLNVWKNHKRSWITFNNIFIFHHLTVVQLLFCHSKKGLNPKICPFCTVFFLFFNLLRVWILLWNASSQFCFNFAVNLMTMALHLTGVFLLLSLIHI